MWWNILSIINFAERVLDKKMSGKILFFGANIPLMVLLKNNCQINDKKQIPYDDMFSSAI
jgi:hypothetical protein